LEKKDSFKCVVYSLDKPAVDKKMENKLVKYLSCYLPWQHQNLLHCCLVNLLLALPKTLSYWKKDKITKHEIRASMKHSYIEEVVVKLSHIYHLHIYSPICCIFPIQV